MARADADAGGAEPLPLCPARHPPQSVAACLPIVAGRILSQGEQVTRDDLRRIVMRPSKLPANGRDWKGVIDHAFVDTGCGDAVQLFSHGE
jgi:hypothetical protein